MLGSAESPVFHPALVVEDWGLHEATVTIDGRDARRGEDYRIGHRNTLESSDLLVWLNVEAAVPVQLVVAATERVR